MGQFGSGLSSKGSPGTLAATSEEVAALWASHRALHPDVRVSTVLKGIANKNVSERSLTCAEGASATSPRPDGVTSYTGCTIKVAELRNAFWEQPLSPVFLTMCSMRPRSESALQAEGSEPYCAQRRYSQGCCFGRARIEMWARVRDDSSRSHLMSTQLGWTQVRDGSGMPQFKKRLHISSNNSARGGKSSCFVRHHVAWKEHATLTAV